MTAGIAEQALEAFESRVRSGDAELFVRRVGGGPRAAALLAVHAGPGLSHEPLRTLEALATPGLEVVNFDQRGCGRSLGQVEPARVFDQAVADLTAVRRSLGVEQVHLLGHGFGGLLAALSAARHPEGLGSLVLVDALPATAEDLASALSRERQRLAEYRRRGLVPDELPAVEEDPAGWLLALLPVFFLNPRHPGARTLAGARLSTATAKLACSALDAYDMRSELAAVRVPTLHVMTPVPFGYAMGEAMASALPNAPSRRVLLTTAGHLPFIEAPSTFLGVLAGFLGRESVLA